jgi:hypothetical protein
VTVRNLADDELLLFNSIGSNRIALNVTPFSINMFTPMAAVPLFHRFQNSVKNSSWKDSMFLGVDYYRNLMA